MTRSFLVLALVVAFGAPASANPHLDRAKELEEGLEYAAALDELREAVVYGGNTRQELLEIYWLTGEVAGGLGDEDTAYNAFRRLVAIDGTYELPAGTSPKIAVPYRRAVDSLASGELIRVSTSFRDGTIEIVVVSDPIGMVAGARALFEAGGVPTDSYADGASLVRIGLPAGATQISVEIVDKHDNVLVVSHPDTGESQRPYQPTPMPLPASPSTPIYARWWLWGGVSAGSAAIGVAFGLATNAAQDDLADAKANSETVRYDEIESIVSRGRRNALITNISFGVAGVAAAVAVWAFATRGGDSGVGLAPTADGGLTMTAIGRF